jgi:hypothetical protein
VADCRTKAMRSDSICENWCTTCVTTNGCWVEPAMLGNAVDVQCKQECYDICEENIGADSSLCTCSDHGVCVSGCEENCTLLDVCTDHCTGISGDPSSCATLCGNCVTTWGCWTNDTAWVTSNSSDCNTTCF